MCAVTKTYAVFMAAALRLGIGTVKELSARLGITEQTLGRKLKKNPRTLTLGELSDASEIIKLTDEEIIQIVRENAFRRA